MASLAGLAYWALQNNALGDVLVVNVGGKDRAMVAEMAPNVLSGGRQVPQLRFICDGYAGLYAKHPSKNCRAVDRQAQANAHVAAPPGLVRDTGTKVPVPYRSGAGTSSFGGRQPFQSPLPLGGNF